jgi:hypothetical protein
MHGFVEDHLMGDGCISRTGLDTSTLTEKLVAMN